MSEADWSEEPETEPTGPTLDERVEDYTRRTTRTLEERIEELQTELVQLRAEERRAQLEAAEAAKQAQAATEEGAAPEPEDPPTEAEEGTAGNGTTPIATGEPNWADDPKKRQVALDAMDTLGLNHRDARQALSDDCGETVVRLAQYPKGLKPALAAFQAFAEARKAEVAATEQGKLV